MKLYIIESPVFRPYPKWDVTGMNLMYVYAKLILENLLFFYKANDDYGYMYVWRNFTRRP